MTARTTRTAPLECCTDSSAGRSQGHAEMFWLLMTAIVVGAVLGVLAWELS